ncbi:class III lanthionine synthetase LanKC [Rhizomonospora bruguierae]|uniref:class III lanthionine synthetase LanKC n=1 Tax=Rhizomonospora bruguierae TaxID=1581705 RepID=UPI001BD05210|nr:class III lanthionine synthetase LanKC [Micromonospora sp. NBRC 107566]
MTMIAHLQCCPPGTPFFDMPDRDAGRYELSDAPVPAGWQRTTDPDWVGVMPPAPLPPQGWKIHVSATPATSDDVLRICWDRCLAAGVGFKFLKSREVLFLRSGKYGDRTASGKFITIYPRDDAEAARLLDDLDPLLRGMPGPTILSDLRWRAGPLHVRYGGFVRRETRDASGRRVLAIERPDGTLVPDERRPGFHVPDWVVLPPFLATAVEERGRGRLTDFPYRPTRALHFSNGGGVYRGVGTAGAPVLLKEARPLAGIDGAGEDAVARLKREHTALQQLSGMPGIPRLIDYRKGHEHWFLVREEIDGTPLSVWTATHNPLLGADTDVARYTADALSVLAEVQDGVAAMHERGLAYRDLHPGNILMRSDGSLAFIDLEAARPLTDDEAQTMGAPGYMAPPEFRGASVDRYALGVLALDLFVPLAGLLRWSPGKAAEILELVRRHFPVPSDYADRVQRLLASPGGAVSPAPPTGAGPFGVSVPREDWADAVKVPVLTERLTRGLLSTATPDRADRLYPGDAAQIWDPAGGLSFFHGAAGVLWTLATSGRGAPAGHAEWFRTAVDQTRWERCGLGDGAAGVALAQHAMGETERAERTLRRAVELGQDTASGRLADGLSGLGLVLLELAATDPAADSAERWIQEAERLVPAVSRWVPDQRDMRWGPGLLGGTTGPALFLLRLHAATGGAGLLDLAERAVRADLIGWGWDPQETSSAGLPAALSRTPHLAGAAGTALVLQELLRLRPDAELAAVLAALRAACAAPFATEAGLLYGRAGLILALDALGVDRAVIDSHIRDLRVHSVLRDGELLVAGRYSLRASGDLATGAAGVLLALDAAVGAGAVARLPFLPPPPGHRPGCAAQAEAEVERSIA